MYLLTYTHAHILIHIYTCTHTYTHAHTHIHTCTNTYSCTHMHAHIHTCTYSHIHMHTHTVTHEYTHTHIHTSTHTHIHTCMHTYSHTHSHLYTCPPMDPPTNTGMGVQIHPGTHMPQTCTTYPHMHHRHPFHRHSVHIIICTTSYVSCTHARYSYDHISPPTHILRCAHSFSCLKVGFASAEAALQEADKLPGNPLPS